MTSFRFVCYNLIIFTRRKKKKKEHDTTFVCKFLNIYMYIFIQVRKTNKTSHVIFDLVIVYEMWEKVMICNDLLLINEKRRSAKSKSK